MPLTVEHPGPIYIRIAKGGDPIVTNDTPFEIGKAFPMRPGNDALIVSTGVMLKRALEAAELLHLEGLEASVLHVPTVKPLDQATILGYAARVPAIVTVEEHTIVGGLGSAVAEILAEANFSDSKRFKRIGIPDTFPDQYGSQDSLLARYGITAQNIANTIQQLTHTKTKESYQEQSWAD
jgi:transketolase